MDREQRHQYQCPGVVKRQIIGGTDAPIRMLHTEITAVQKAIMIGLVPEKEGVGRGEGQNPQQIHPHLDPAEPAKAEDCPRADHQERAERAL